MENDFIFYGKQCPERYTFFNIIKSIIENPDNAKEQIKSALKDIITFALKFNLQGNIYKQYLAYLLISDVNPFTLIHQRRKITSSTSFAIALHDLEIFYDYFNYDFRKIEEELKTNVFSLLFDYHETGVRKSYGVDVKDKIVHFASVLNSCNNLDEFAIAVQKFYQIYGCGDMALWSSFRIDYKEDIGLQLIANTTQKKVNYQDIIGYERQKKQVRDNTSRFLSSHRANNMLLYGESGTGKSETIKATLNYFAKRGLRLIEVYRNQFSLIPLLVDKLRDLNYKFLIYLDDLSFDEKETEYKYLKAIIEGSRDTRSANVLVYATSNRRNLIQETYRDSQDTYLDDDIHKSETKEEKQSLSNRFGLSVYYGKPKEEEFFDIVRALAKKRRLEISDEELISKARSWGMENSGFSGRSATQFVDSL